MSLIHDIQAAAISQTTDVPTLLRMCKLLAARISHQQFGDWVDRELNGYPNIDSLPDYRVVEVNSYGTFIGPYARANRMQVPVFVLPEEFHEHFRNAYMGSSISVYAALLEGDKTARIEEPWPLAAAIHHASKVMRNMECLAAWKEIPIGAVVRLLDSVKTRVLGFAIDLEREAPNAGDMPIGSQPPLSSEKMTQIFNTNISGNVGNVSNSGERFAQTAMVHAGNWEALAEQLVALGLRPVDFQEMRSEFDQAVTSGDDEEKSRVAGTWIGRLATRAMAGAAGVGIEVATAGVAKAIATYLGIPGA